MSVTKEKKQSLITEHKRGEKDTGSPEVQIALLTSRIMELTDHMKLHDKDYASRRGLIKMVNNRNSLLTYLKNRDRARYQSIIGKLGLRK